jgi:hypothetical protein
LREREGLGIGALDRWQLVFISPMDVGKIRRKLRDIYRLGNGRVDLLMSRLAELLRNLPDQGYAAIPGFRRRDFLDPRGDPEIDCHTVSARPGTAWE